LSQSKHNAETAVKRFGCRIVSHSRCLCNTAVYDAVNQTLINKHEG